MALDDQRGMLGTVRNAALLLELLSEGPAYHQLTDLADRAGMSLPTVHRLLRSLIAAGLAEQDPKSARYGLGPQLVYLSERYLGRLGVVKAAAPYLVELRDSLNASVLVAVLIRGHVVYVDRVDGGDTGGAFRQASRLRHAFQTPGGRLLVARAGSDAWRHAEAALAHADGVKRPTPAQRQAWARASYLISQSDGPGSSFEIAVPIDSDGGVLAALTATGSLQDYDRPALKRTLAPQLERAAQAIARTVGHG